MQHAANQLRPGRVGSEGCPGRTLVRERRKLNQHQKPIMPVSQRKLPTAGNDHCIPENQVGATGFEPPTSWASTVRSCSQKCLEPNDFSRELRAWQIRLTNLDHTLVSSQVLTRQRLKSWRLDAVRTFFQAVAELQLLDPVTCESLASFIARSA